MLATRIIPVLLCRGRQLIKGRQFKSWRSVGLAMQAAQIHAMRGVDELIILDIGATPENRCPDLDLVRELSENCFTPITVGGGVKSVDDVHALLQAGADKVAIGTAAWPLYGDLMQRASEKVGSQALVACVDYRSDVAWIECGAVPTSYHPGALAVDMAAAGAGEILLTSIDREGMMGGYDLELIKAVSSAVSIPVIANGGCGSYQHMLEAIQAGANGVAAGALFQFTDDTPAGAARYLHDRGVEVRLIEQAGHNRGSE